MRKLLAVVGLLLGTGCFAGNQHGMVQCDRRELVGYLTRCGYKEVSIYQWWQNAAGTKIYLQDVPYASESRVWIVSRDQGRPLEVLKPQGPEWIDDRDRVRPLPAFVVPAEGRWLHVDLQSGYFCQTDEPAHVLRVGHYDHPQGWLFETHSDPRVFWVSQVCGVAGAVILLDHTHSSTPAGRKNCWILRPGTASERWTKEERSIGGEVRCVDPSGRRLLYWSYSEVPFPTSLCVYDLESRKTVDLGLIPVNQMQFLLLSDFVTPRLQQQPQATGYRTPPAP